MFERNRTRPFLIRYALYLYFLGLSLRITSKALEPFIDRSYVAIWYWIQEFNPKQVYPNKKKARITAFIIDETMIQIGNNDAWFLVASEPMVILFTCMYNAVRSHLSIKKGIDRRR